MIPDEKKVVSRMFEWCAYDYMTTYGIAKRLNAEGVPTIGGKPWSGATLYSILRNPTYKGTWLYGKREIRRVDSPDGVKEKIVQRNRVDSIPVSVPAIVSTELWDAVQMQLEANRKKFVKPANNDTYCAGTCIAGCAMGRLPDLYRLTQDETTGINVATDVSSTERICGRALPSQARTG